MADSDPVSDVYSAVKIYLYDWDRNVRVGLSESDVREAYGISITFTDSADIQKLKKYILAGGFSAAPKNIKPDIRIVLDMETVDHHTNTFLMNKGYIYNGDLTLVKKADSRFVDYLDNIMLR